MRIRSWFRKCSRPRPGMTLTEVSHAYHRRRTHLRSWRTQTDGTSALLLSSTSPASRSLLRSRSFPHPTASNPTCASRTCITHLTTSAAITKRSYRATTHSVNQRKKEMTRRHRNGDRNRLRVCGWATMACMGRNVCSSNTLPMSLRYVRGRSREIRMSREGPAAGTSICAKSCQTRAHRAGRMRGEELWRSVASGKLSCILYILDARGLISPLSVQDVRAKACAYNDR